jgi:hypothetical protein
MTTMVLILSVAVAGVVFLALLNLVGRNQPGLDRAYYMDAWQKIHIKSRAEETWALAVIDADKLLDHALRKKNFAGKTMAERMVSAKDVFTKRQQVWEAHKYRNLLVHDDIKVKSDKVLSALQGFRSALKDVGAL